MFRQDRQYLLSIAPSRFLRMYTDKHGWIAHNPGSYNGESREGQYNELLKAKTPDEWDAIMGNISWTHIWCSECHKYKDSGVSFCEGHDTVVICDDCLKEATHG